MNPFRFIAVIFMGLAVTGCASVETATRNAPLEAPQIQATPLSFDVTDIRVSVPETLRVSEANRYYPGGDIVWREDPQGDRHAQVKAIFETAFAQGVSELEPGLVPVVLEVEVTRFHALTEKARYTIGGVHALQFKMQMRNPQTGQVYGEPHVIKADFRALGGAEAIKAERQGITQKYRITNHLAQVIKTELTDPEGYKAAFLGMMGAINQL